MYYHAQLKWYNMHRESRSFPRSWLITGIVTRITRRVSLVEQELFTLLEHLRSPPLFSGVHVTRSLVLYVCFVDRYLSFCTFLMAFVLSVLLRYTDSDCPFGIFKLFLTRHPPWNPFHNLTHELLQKLIIVYDIEFNADICNRWFSLVCTMFI